MKAWVLAGAVLAALAALAAFEWRAVASPSVSGVGTAVYMLASMSVSIDLLDLLLRVYLRRLNTAPGGASASPTSMPLDIGSFTPYQMRLHLRPYAILVSVHNLGAEVEPFLESLRAHKNRLWVIDDASTDDTFERLERSGINCLRTEVNLRKPGAIARLLTELPQAITTVLILDPDARIVPTGDGQLSDLERVLFEFQRSGAAALCPHIEVRPNGWLVSFQRLEYAMALSLGRKSMGFQCVTSGVAVYRRDSLERLLKEHTLSVYAEDLKNAALLLGRGESIYYDGRLLIETDGKRTLPDWFSQRVGWFFGLVKVYSEHFKDFVLSSNRSFAFIYQFLIYLGLFVIALHPLKLIGAAILALSGLNALDQGLGLGLVPDSIWTRPLYFPLAYSKAVVVAAVALPLSVRPGARLRLLPVVPLYFFYALAQLVPATLGYLNWLSLRLTGRRMYADHYQDETSLRRESPRNGRRP